MSYVKVWNEELCAFSNFDIGKGRVEVDTYNWALIRGIREGEFVAYNIVMYDENLQQNPPLNTQVNLIPDEMFFDTERRNLKEWDENSYYRMKVIRLYVDQFEAVSYTIVVLYGTDVYWLNDDGQTIERL
jgi:hypothetical protein